ncbi:hypothetical protein Tco_0755516, partial [Tanacetum coccineum]
NTVNLCPLDFNQCSPIRVKSAMQVNFLLSIMDLPVKMANISIFASGHMKHDSYKNSVVVIIGDRDVLYDFKVMLSISGRIIVHKRWIKPVDTPEEDNSEIDHLTHLPDPILVMIKLFELARTKKAEFVQVSIDNNQIVASEILFKEGRHDFDLEAAIIDDDDPVLCLNVLSCPST